MQGACTKNSIEAGSELGTCARLPLKRRVSPARVLRCSIIGAGSDFCLEKPAGRGPPCCRCSVGLPRLDYRIQSETASKCLTSIENFKCFHFPRSTFSKYIAVACIYPLFVFISPGFQRALELWALERGLIARRSMDFVIWKDCV